MKKYFESILIYTGFIFLIIIVSGIGVSIVRLILALIFEDHTETLREVKSPIFVILLTVIPFVLIYIFMRRIGYKKNQTYEKFPLKELLITIPVSLFLFRTMDLILRLDIRPATLLGDWLFFITAENNITTGPQYGAFFREYYPTQYIILDFVQLGLFGITMVLGFYMGYKKRGKDRQKITENKNKLTEE